jgi:hypothetical protein
LTLHFLGDNMVASRVCRQGKSFLLDHTLKIPYLF